MADYPSTAAEYVAEVQRLEAEIYKRKQQIYGLMKKAGAEGFNTAALRTVASHDWRGKGFWIGIAETLSDMEAKEHA